MSQKLKKSAILAMINSTFYFLHSASLRKLLKKEVQCFRVKKVK